jgi:hypothetical protein
MQGKSGMAADWLIYPNPGKGMTPAQRIVPLLNPSTILPHSIIQLQTCSARKGQRSAIHIITTTEFCAPRERMRFGTIFSEG